MYKATLGFHADKSELETFKSLQRVLYNIWVSQFERKSKQMNETCYLFLNVYSLLLQV